MIADAHVDLLMEPAYRERRLGETDVFGADLAAAPGARRGRPPGLPDLRRRDGAAGGLAARGPLDGRVLPPRAPRERRICVVQVESAPPISTTWRPAGGCRRVCAVARGGGAVRRRDVAGGRLPRALGVRMAGLTWNRRNAFADGAAEEGRWPLAAGPELVDRLVGLGVVLDLAHASRGTSSRRCWSVWPARCSCARTADVARRPRDPANPRRRSAGGACKTQTGCSN